jgi:hypothetical protein
MTMLLLTPSIDNYNIEVMEICNGRSRQNTAYNNVLKFHKMIYQNLFKNVSLLSNILV